MFTKDIRDWVSYMLLGGMRGDEGGGRESAEVARFTRDSKSSIEESGGTEVSEGLFLISTLGEEEVLLLISPLPILPPITMLLAPPIAGEEVAGVWGVAALLTMPMVPPMPLLWLLKKHSLPLRGTGGWLNPLERELLLLTPPCRLA